MRGTISPAQMRQLAADVAHLPALVGRALERDAEYQALAERFHRAHNFLFLGRGINYPIAMEGALKPVSYTHLDVYKRQALTMGTAAPVSTWPHSASST